MVLLQTDAARGKPGLSADAVGTCLDMACAVLAPPPPRLIAIGGFSGSGKSVLASALAPDIGPLPGAVILSSDLERKAGRSLDARLDPADYTVDRRTNVFNAMLDRAATLLGAGHSALVDATFFDARLRAAVEDVAARAGVLFQGVWLDAPEPVLRARLRSRKGDASDADVAVLQQQLTVGHGDMIWCRLDASDEPGMVCEAAQRSLAS